MTVFHQPRAAAVAACAIAIALAGCGQTPRPQASRPVLVQPIGNADQVSDVVAALEAGDVDRARRMLAAMAKRDPTDAQVLILKQSIEADPVALLGTRSFAYVVERGDTLPELAQRHLGNRLKFFLLARYNGLKTGQLTRGQSLRIPGTAPVAAPPPPRAPQPQKAQQPQPVPLRPPVAPPATPVANPALAAALRGRGLAALNAGKVAQAVVILRRARAADPANPAVQRDLGRAERLMAAVRARK